MEQDMTQIGSAVASPTKDFFVKMLTRDIELQDALLDLLDNCVDGIIRQGVKTKDADLPYDGYEAKITFSAGYFVIEDNCGGIPLEIAKKQAFAMGKPRGAADLVGTATVGMYGIGMKRAIFKIGTEALVESHNDTGFIVEISPEWMKSETWDELPMYELGDGVIKCGTRIEVHELNEEAKAAFVDSVWIDDFRKIVSRHYALIIEKGFSVQIGNPDEIAVGIEPVTSAGFQFLRSVAEEGGGVDPYIYVGEIDGVSVEIYAGLYRELLTDEESEEEERTRGTIDDAGWTVACNDRVVIWKDKTRLTGWGEADVPNYHAQFIAITGVVLLRSSDPKKLPLTTTKRGVDASSNLFSEVKDMMREATKNLTTFTNRWKKFPDKLDKIYKDATYITLSEVRALPSTLKMTKSRKNASFIKYLPEYPVPAQERNSARVSFVALKSHIEVLKEHYFGDEKVKPGVVGELAFKEKLAQISGESK